MRKPSLSSFTLVELMAAMAVLALLMVALVAMFDQAMRGWRQAQKGIDGRREARAALQMLERDLGGLIVLPGRKIWLTNTEDAKAASLYFLTTLSSSAQASGGATNADVCGVGYFVEWDPSLNEGRGSRVLRRYQQEPAQQLLRLQTPPDSIISRTSLFPDSGEGITVETLAQNISHFRVEIFQWTNNANFDPAAGAEDGARKPAYLSIELAAYDPQTVRSFQSTNDWDSSNNVTKYARTYIWRVVP